MPTALAGKKNNILMTKRKSVIYIYIHIVLDVLLSSIVEYFYELCQQNV